MAGTITPATEEAISRAASCLLHGQLIGLPTETVYGLAARGDDAEAVAQIFAAKNRPRNNPLILHTASAADAFTLFADDCSPQLWQRARRLSGFWPGPLTLIAPRHRSILDDVTAGGDTVAVRVPNHPVAIAVLQSLAGRAGQVVPVAAPSANRSNYVSPTTAQHVAEGLGDQVEMILDGGPCHVGLESTIVLLPADDSPLCVLRSGAISPAQLSEAVGEPVESLPASPRGAAVVAAPGQFAKHYSPQTPLSLSSDPTPGGVRCDRSGRVLQIVFGPIDAVPGGDCGHMWSFNPDGKLETAAAQLYATLRRADDAQYEAIQVSGCPEVGLGVAIMDRLRRASQK
ncbi:Threonylcarbamoyl-AMP synthase [Allorhodopirellula solitaria]|uniref:Threonylcarbamoyl-AMP synthase n=1 Tax=Allorhodopirellula solitaria TaxID=2527987 RepID=A0A5C5WZS0_9BACT|nr:Threonylcarbamoyl-AMP synthase [Allorhodopirellula solitaria]